MRYLFIALSLLVSPLTRAHAQVGVAVGVPGIEIGVSVGAYPDLVPVPGYPVYYDPRGSANYFYYDGLFWVYQADSWYASSWYDGPWQSVGPASVPLFVLRVPVRYYRRPPVYFRGWRGDLAPRWGDHWGPAWQARRGGWERWDHRSTPRPAPLPVYQRGYSGDHYPRAVGQQRAIRSENFRYQPREAVSRQQYQRPGDSGGRRADLQRPAPAQQRPSNPPRPVHQDERRSRPGQQDERRQGPQAQPARPGQQDERRQGPQAQPARPGPQREFRQQPQPARPGQQARPAQPAPRAQPAPPQRGHGESRDRGRENRNEERGQDRR